MYKAIQNYCNNGNNNGLFLLDMPTGYEKTYSVLKYIYEASLDESNSKKRFFFITTLKKNLPIEELKKRFTDADQLDKFNEKFLFIDANADCVIDGLTTVLITQDFMLMTDIREQNLTAPAFKNCLRILKTDLSVR